MEYTKLWTQVIEDLKSYPTLKRKISLLHYEQEHPARITDGEVIDSMAFSRSIGDGIKRPGCISDKIMLIAAQFRNKTDRWTRSRLRSSENTILRREPGVAHLAPRPLIKRRDDGLNALVFIYMYLRQITKKGDNQ